MFEEIELLQALPAAALDEQLRRGRARVARFARHQVLHFEGERCEFFEVILSGRVLVERIAEQGELLTISAFGAGEILGGSLLFSQQPYYPMTVTAAEDSALLRLGREALLDLLDGHRAFLEAYLQWVADHASLLGDVLRTSVKRSIREGVLQFLASERRRQGTNRILRVLEDGIGASPGRRAHVAVARAREDAGRRAHPLRCREHNAPR